MANVGVIRYDAGAKAFYGVYKQDEKQGKPDSGLTPHPNGTQRERRKKDGNV